MLTLDNVYRASNVLREVVRKTDVVYAPKLKPGVDLYLKTENLQIKEKIKISEKVLLRSAEDIDALFRMTPYYYHTRPEDKMKLQGVESLEVTLDFAVYVMKKP